MIYPLYYGLIQFLALYNIQIHLRGTGNMSWGYLAFFPLTTRGSKSDKGMDAWKTFKCIELYSTLVSKFIWYDDLGTQEDYRKECFLLLCCKKVLCTNSLKIVVQINKHILFKTQDLHCGHTFFLNGRHYVFSKHIVPFHCTYITILKILYISNTKKFDFTIWNVIFQLIWK